MSDDLEVTGGVGGMDRRDFIRKGAIVGGMAGMVWAAPAISSLGSPAFAGTPEGQAISNIAFVLGNADPEQRYKFDGESLPCTAEGANTVRPCVDGLYDDYKAQYDQWCDADYTTQDLLESIECDDPYEWTITAKPSYTVQWAVVKTGVKSDHCRLFLPETPGQTLVVNTTGGVATPFLEGNQHPC